VPARQHGNIIELAVTSVGVEEACSGVRSLLSCVYAGFFFAAWQVRRPGGRLLLIVVAPAAGPGMNFLRSLTLTLLANGGHEIAGFCTMPPICHPRVTALVLAGLAVLLESKPPTVPAPPAATPPGGPLPQWPLRVFWTASAPRWPLAAFFFINSRPATRTGEPARFSPTSCLSARRLVVLTPNDLYQFAGILNTSHLIERTYVRTAGDGRMIQLTVYVAYWSPGRRRQRVASHTPDACWPGSGWMAKAVLDEQEVRGCRV